MVRPLFSVKTNDFQRTNLLFPSGEEFVHAGATLGHDGPKWPKSVSAAPPVLSDAEIDDICAGLKQNAAKVRFLRDVLKVSAQRKPNGRPLVLRADWERRTERIQSGYANRGPNWSKTA
jgi:hypothetical protein